MPSATATSAVSATAWLTSRARCGWRSTASSRAPRPRPARPATPPCRPGRRTYRASVGRCRRSVQRPAQVRRAGCLRPGRRRGPREPPPAQSVLLRRGSRQSAPTDRGRAPRATSSATSQRPGRATRVTAGLTLSAASSAVVWSRSPSSASRNPSTIQRGWLCVSDKCPIGSMSKRGEITAHQPAKSRAATLRNTALTRPVGPCPTLSRTNFTDSSTAAWSPIRVASS